MKEKIKIENNHAELGRVVNWLEMLGDKYALSARIIFDLNLCLDELITNIISYGYNDEKIHQIEIIYEHIIDLLELRIIDDGKKFDPLQNENPELDLSLEDKPIGGLGIHLVKNIMDEVIYRYEKSKNILILRKKMKQ